MPILLGGMIGLAIGIWMTGAEKRDGHGHIWSQYGTYVYLTVITGLFGVIGHVIDTAGRM